MHPARVALLAIALLAACGPGTTLSAGTALATDRVRIFDDASTPETRWGYDPSRIQVARGTTVTFTNAGSVFHTVTSDDPQRTFDKGAGPGERVTIAFDQAGDWAYHCGVHPAMKGTVHVCDGACP